MPFVEGWLRARRRGHMDQELPGSGHIDQTLPPGEGDADPGYDHPIFGHAGDALPPGIPPIAGTLPEPPPGTWPPPSFHRPVVPALPIAPGAGTKPVDPGAPPVATQPPMGSQLPSAGGPPPGTIWPPVNGASPQRLWVVCGIPGVGWRYVCVDPSLRADAGLPPAATPKG